MKPAKLSVSFNKKCFTPGEEIAFKIKLYSEDEFTIDESIAEFYGIQKLTYIEGPGGPKHVEETYLFHELILLERNFKVQPHSKYEWDYAFLLPPDIPPSYRGDSISVNYSLYVNFKIRHAQTIEKTSSIKIVQKPISPKIIEYKKSFNSFDVHLKVPDVAIAGFDFAGTLIITPHIELHFAKIRFDLIREEEVIYGRFLKHKSIVVRKLRKFIIDESRQLVRDKEYIHRFSIKIPNNLASFKTEKAITRYYGEIHFERKLLPDFSLRFPLKILKIT